MMYTKLLQRGCYMRSSSGIVTSRCMAFHLAMYQDVSTIHSWSFDHCFRHVGTETLNNFQDGAVQVKDSTFQRPTDSGVI
ncbi:hypothetical protein DPMN_145373 [Dreissena polymorpha]|uniref:Uncharacterized protein n=1 Tax=Dreissena polymorpha TaxID=45954 RepID=A0A9D4F9R4_DREPO|nr:hypothetical protein DPMN_145373 [Dreissena polymorpha]